ncbi:MAG: hypothetical protein HOU81_09550 [Hamadaea sp.]|uniref:hypothetical protein n=1 Tax=Hamadaea sp. TaxID=2024425 RepID=UPI001836127A|nr:hypothetical protein [Hamadaea sp.]NUR71055.1 hypothetical protein [Hamadaea sp.]NUT24000.1 hypothetical protein [Hamadaea sp.]
MLATTRARRPLLLDVPLDLALLRGSRVTFAPSWHLPALPPGWRPVAGSRIRTPSQRYAVHATEDGMLVSLHSTVGLDEGDLGRRLASISLSGHRIGVHPDDSGFTAVWEAHGVRHRLTARPCSLAAFMELLMSLTWPGAS